MRGTHEEVFYFFLMQILFNLLETTNIQAAPPKFNLIFLAFLQFHPALQGHS